MYLITKIPYPLERVLTVSGEYIPGEPATRDNPGTPGRFTAKAVEVKTANNVGEVDLIQIFDRDELDEIESRAVEALELREISKVGT